MGCDANSHHIVWGSSDTNVRGKSLLDFIVSNDLYVLNKGNSPTFVTANRQEVIDITMGTLEASKFILDWKVSTQYQTTNGSVSNWWRIDLH